MAATGSPSCDTLAPVKLIALTLAACCCTAPAAEPPRVATFSIIGRDPATGEIGVAVQSKVVAVGAIVPYAKAGVGAVATQSAANVTYGPRGLAMLAAGKSPGEAVAALTEADEKRAIRQLGILSADGGSATFTGDRCFPWAGGKKGENCVAQGNILAGAEVIDAMVEAFEAGRGKVLAERLLDALEAGQEKGGDRRGRQSASLLVVRERWGHRGGDDRFRDLRVDEHEKPIKELRRIYRMHRKLIPRPTDDP